MLKTIESGVLQVGYEEHGPTNGATVFLLHGFPYDIRAYDDVAEQLAAQGCRVIVPYLRGYGPTRFLEKTTPRSGQQASLAADLIALMDTLHIDSAVLAGYDWGGRAACIVAALWPHRAQGLVSGGGYNIHDIANSHRPTTPNDEFRYWYQYYFHSERGRAGLTEQRNIFCKQLWELWSPNWTFTSKTFEATARSFENPDFVDVVIHSYRHRYGLVAGDPAVSEIATQLTRKPQITVPTVALDGGGDGVAQGGGSVGHADRFGAHFVHRTIPKAGHNLPQEAPKEFAQAVLDLL